ncbi:MAG: D-inositol 3-phosphate glycosyltransferase [Syntrophomonadaceae bacterium]|nr:D-inositol 3-phosphate glycosyltransferase [Bacillota bacterium]
MRILLTVHQFLPDYAAGTEILTCSVARELLARGHEVHVLTGFPTEHALKDEERCDEYDFEGIHVYRFHHACTPLAGQGSKIALGYDNHLATAYFGRILQRYQPDVVHFFHLSRLGAGLIERAAQAKTPAFLTPTDFWAVCPTAQLLLPNNRLCQGPNAQAGNCVKHLAQRTQSGPVAKVARWLPVPLANLLVRLTRAGVLPAYPHQAEVGAISSRLGASVARLNQLTKIVAPNRFMRDLLVRHGVHPRRIVQAAFGIDVTGTATPAPRAPPRQPFRLGFIGTLARHKGCHVLMEGFKSLPPGRAILKIYGNPMDFPDYAGELKHQAGHDPAIEFCGVFHNSRIAEVLANLDALVVPSLWVENNPLVLYSAQAARCPVVASDFPGISAVIRDGENGLLFEAGNVAALARQLSRLIDEHGLAERLSAHCRRPKATADYVDELLDIWKTA